MSPSIQRPAVQDSYPDTRVAGYPGQLADLRSVSREAVASYTSETRVYVGRAVVKGRLDSDPFNLQPFAVKAPVASSTAADLQGIVAYTYAAELDEDGAAFLPGNTLVGVIEAGHGVLVYVSMAQELVLSHGDPVYVAVASGSFSNQPGDGLVEWPGVIWFKQVGPELAVVRL